MGYLRAPHAQPMGYPRENPEQSMANPQAPGRLLWEAYELSVGFP